MGAGDLDLFRVGAAMHCVTHAFDLPLITRTRRLAMSGIEARSARRFQRQGKLHRP